MAKGPQGYRRASAGVGGAAKSTAEGRFDALHMTDLTDLVGREEELELLLHADRPPDYTSGFHRPVSEAPRVLHPSRRPRRRIAHRSKVVFLR